VRFLRTEPQTGYTVIELIVVIVVVGILSSLMFGAFQGSQGRARDVDRVTDIDNLHSKLEAYYSDNGGYPNTFTASTFPGISPDALKDYQDVSIVIASPASDQAAALASSNPTASANYKYIPYPTGCTAITCTGYILKTYIEQPNGDTPNPYVRYGLNNN
jgi:prepilin-type N-terminal cleavage/methylation domain-containing protein